MFLKLLIYQYFSYLQLSIGKLKCRNLFDIQEVILSQSNAYERNFKKNQLKIIKQTAITGYLYALLS